MFISLQIRYAYELLTNPIWKRNYDVFGIDEQLVSISLQPTCCVYFYLPSLISQQRKRALCGVLHCFIEWYYHLGLQHVVEKVSQQYAEEKFSNIELPLLHVDASGSEIVNIYLLFLDFHVFIYFHSKSSFKKIYMRLMDGHFLQILEMMLSI